MSTRNARAHVASGSPRRRWISLIATASLLMGGAAWAAPEESGPATESPAATEAPQSPGATESPDATESPAATEAPGATEAPTVTDPVPDPAVTDDAPTAPDVPLAEPNFPPAPQFAPQVDVAPLAEVVEIAPLAVVPLTCGAGDVYGVEAGGQLVHVSPTGTISDVGSPAPNVAAFNGLGIGAGGHTVYGYERTAGNNIASLYEYSVASGVWSSLAVSVNSQNDDRTVQFVAGAVDLASGTYYFGGFNGIGTVFRLWKWSPGDTAATYAGYLDTTYEASNTTNGDIAFNASGDLFVVRGSGTLSTLFSVTSDNLAGASGGLIPSTNAASVTTHNNVNGIAFDSAGRVFLGSDSQLRSYAMPTFTDEATVVASGLGTTDLATCSSPPTITVQKNVVGRAMSTDQFTLTLRQGDRTIATTTTTGQTPGIQGEQIGPIPTARNVTLSFDETGANGANLANYNSTWVCTDQRGITVGQGGAGTSGSVTIPASTAVTDVTCVITNDPAAWDLTKTSAPASGSTVAPGSDITYTLTATNDSAVAVSGVVVTDDLAGVLAHTGGVTGITASLGSATVSGTTLTWTVGTLGAGSSATLSYTVRVDDDAFGVELINAVTGTGSVPPINCVPGQPCSTTHETPPAPVLTLVKEVSNGDTGGSAVPTDWPLSATGPETIAGVSGSEDVTGVSVSPGAYALAEGDGPTGYDLTSLVCVDIQGAPIEGVSLESPEVSLAVGDDVTCTFTNTALAPEWTFFKSSVPASGSTVAPGDEITYTVTAVRSGGVPATGVVITDDLSGVLGYATLEDASIVASQGSAALSGEDLVWNLGTLAATQTLTYTVTVDADAVGVTIRNVVTGDGHVPPGPCPEDDRDCRTTEHDTPAWSLVKSSDPASGSTVNPGDTIAYTLTAVNTSDAVLEGAVATDDLSAVVNNAELLEPLAAGLTLSGDGQTLTWAIPTLERGDEAVVTYSVTVNDDAIDVTLRNVVTGTGPVPPSECPDGEGEGEAADEDCRSTEHYTSAWDLVKSSDPASGSTVEPGDEITYTLTATNTATSGAELVGAVAVDDLSDVLNNAALVEPLPAGLVFDEETKTLTWAIPTLAEGESASTSFVVVVNDDAIGVTLRNVVTGDGPVPPGECPVDEPDCRETEHPTPAWTISKASDPVSGSTVEPGDSIAYTLTVRNISDAVVSGKAAIDDLADVLAYADLVEPLAAGLTFDAEAETLTWAIPDLEPGESATVSYSVTVHADAWGVTLRNAVTSPGSSPCPTEIEIRPQSFVELTLSVILDDEEPGEELCPTTTEHHTPAWEISKTSDPVSGSTVEPGDVVTYTLTAHNTSTAMVEGKTAIDDLSGVLAHGALVEPLADGLVLDAETGMLTWSIPTLAPEESASVSYQVTVAADAVGVTLRNVVTPGEPGGECTEHCSTEHPTPAWVISKTSDPKTGSAVVAGQKVVYTLTATNTSDAELVGAQAIDDLSSVLPYADVTSLGEGLVRDGSTLTWSIPTLAPGESATVTYTVTVKAFTKAFTMKNVVAPVGPLGECEGTCSTTHTGTPKPTPPRPPLPGTGASVGTAGLIAGLLLLGGGAALVLTRRRKDGTPEE